MSKLFFDNAITEIDILGPQFSAECEILSQSAELASFRGISMFSQNSAEFGTGR